MRGKVPQFYFSQIVYRITPAYAGKRRRVRGQCRRQQDHPRLCGEKYQRHFQHLPRLGSPPPMRGKAFDPSLIILNKRITPAYAGKREFRRVQTLLHQDHPRLCGEKSAEIMAEHDAEGITPAYAGKRVPKIPQTQRTRDHPRLCGEKGGFRHLASLDLGSPPPMRGKD